MLQRGRARAGAEIRRTENKNASDHRASTGPRPRGRGNQLLTPLVAGLMATLQRGRARAGAEISYLQENGQSNSALQRGRARAGAEMCAWARRARGGNEASTGPRPRGRGNDVEPILATSALAGFNGAAPARARKCQRANVLRRHADGLQRGRARAGAEMR